MSVGLAVDKLTLDSHAGRLALDLRNTLDAITRLQTYLAATADADLISMGYTSYEVAVLKSAIGDLSTVASVANGDVLPTELTDYFTFAKQLLGVN